MWLLNNIFMPMSPQNLQSWWDYKASRVKLKDLKSNTNKAVSHPDNKQDRIEGAEVTGGLLRRIPPPSTQPSEPGIARFKILSKINLPIHFFILFSCIGGGNGNPLQCSCLENPRDGGAWWAAVYEVTQSRTRLKWLSSSVITTFYFSPTEICVVIFHCGFNMHFSDG